MSPHQTAGSQSSSAGNVLTATPAVCCRMKKCWVLLQVLTLLLCCTSDICTTVHSLVPHTAQSWLLLLSALLSLVDVPQRQSCKQECMECFENRD